ncbi:MAG: DUF5057 domain-containing protein [Eubacterium sp.]|nr:DUF5057 domain-containing protein [Eubacterium sp.]
MKKKKAFDIKRNRSRKNNKNIVFLAIASIVAAVTAAFGILKYRGKKTADEEAGKETDSGDSAETKAPSVQQETGTQDTQKLSRLEHRKINPGELDWETLAREKEVEQIRRGEIPEYMLRNAKKLKHGAWGRKWKIALSGVAILLAAAIVFYHVVQRLRPAEVMAKESFAGIGKIVEAHGEDDPYKILDIVPSKAQIPDSDTPVSFTTGTLGYLAGGKVPFADELKTVFEGNSAFSHYENRESFMSKLLSETSQNAFPWMKYEEAYGGVHDVSAANGWTELFADSLEIPTDANGNYDLSQINLSEMTDGAFRGEYVEWKDGDRTGFDFISADDMGRAGLNASGLSNKYVYIYFEGTEADPSHWYPVELTAYYEKFLPDGYPAYMLKADEVRRITISGQGPNCSADDYVYLFDGQVYSPVNPAEKVGELYKRIPAAGTPAQPSEPAEQTPDTPAGTPPEIPADTPTETPPEIPADTPTGTMPETTTGTTIGTESGTTADTTTETTPEQTTDTTSDTTTEETQAMEQASDVKDVVLLDNKNTVTACGWRKLVEDEGSGETGGTEQPAQPPQSADTSNTEPPGEETTYYVIDASAFVMMSSEELAAMTADDSFGTGMPEDGEGITPIEAEDTPAVADAGKFIYVGSGLGNYKLTKTDAGTGEQLHIYNAPVYFRCQAGNDWLRKYVFNSLSDGDNANGSFKIEVTTVRADEVTSEMVSEADLIYMESGENVFLNHSLLQYSYIYHMDQDLDEEFDMKSDVVNAILSRASDDLMPVIMDYAITEDINNYADTNYQLLAKALLKRDLADFYEAMRSKGNLTANLRMNLGTKAGNGDNLEYPNKYSDNFKCSYVNQNIYVVKDEPLVSDDFAAVFDDYTAKAGFGDVLAAITAENSILAAEDRMKLEVSKARAIQYIINFSIGMIGEFDDLTILELQPAANIDFTSGGVISDLHTNEDGKGNTKLIWQTDSAKTGKQILYSEKSFAIHPVVKSVVEFNGEWEDINGVYDMIFIGLDGRNLNLDNGKSGKPIYNNSNLNGKVYHTGDNASNGTYDCNDITPQKMEDLLDYLKAGYPIVVENECFKDGTVHGASADRINTKYIGEDTVMYHFLSAAVSGDEYKDSIFTVSDTMSSALFMAQVKTARPRIELSDADNPEADAASEIAKIQRLRLDENDEYHGRIAYRIRNNRGQEYLGSTTMRLYADMNYDGIFGAEEELTEYVNDGSVIDVSLSGMGPGIVPWKLEVSDTGNGYRRHSVQGYFELLSPYAEEIRVLQVTSKKGDFGVDLAAMYSQKNDSMLARYLKDAESNSNLAFEFESVTLEMLNERMADNAAYLNQWDVVVLTLDDHVAVGTLALFTTYINEGRSLLVCSQNEGNSNAGLTPEISDILGWSGGKTFVSLGASDLHRYAGLKDEMYAAQGEKAEKINEGSILYYPYWMGGNSFHFSNAASGLRASEYLLDFDNNLKSERTATYVTAWLTLGGSTNTAYGISPRDARNNYYCYSKGNVVYLAQSEYRYTCNAAENELPEGKEGCDECKFFVNALMAAYNAGIHSADVSIVSGFAKTSVPMKSISVPFDQEWENTADDTSRGILDNTVDVYFKFADSNIGVNKNMKVSFYYEDPSGTRTFTVGDRQVQATQFGSEIWTVTDNKLVLVSVDNLQNPGMVNLIPGKVYRIKAPVISLRTLADEKTNDAGIYVLVESEFKRTGKTYRAEGFGTVSLNRAKLFRLE